MLVLWVATAMMPDKQARIRPESLTPTSNNSNCQGKAPVEIYEHMETNDGGTSSNNITQQAPSHPHSPGLPPSSRHPWGEGSGGKDIFQGMFDDVLSGVFGGLFGALGVPPGAGGMHPPFEGGEGHQQQRHPMHGRPPAPPHSFPRGGWQPGAGGGGNPPAYNCEGGHGDVTEI